MAEPLEVLTDHVLATVWEIDPTIILVERRDAPVINRLTLASAACRRVLDDPKYDDSAGRAWMVDIDIDATNGLAVRIRSPIGEHTTFDMTDPASFDKLEAALRRLCSPK